MKKGSVSTLLEFINAAFLHLLLLVHLSCTQSRFHYSGEGSIQDFLQASLALNSPEIKIPETDEVYTNGSTLSIQGQCANSKSSLKVHLGGDSNSTVTCDSHNQFHFNVVASTDGTFRYSLSQFDPKGKTSESKRLIWHRSTVPPRPPVISSPMNLVTTTASMTITGTCSSGHRILVNGDAEFDTVCGTNGKFSVVVSKSSNRTYVFEVRQKDQYENQSVPAIVSWSRVSDMVMPPRLRYPNGNVFLSFEKNLNIVGECITGNFVELMTTESQSVLCSNGQFEFHVNEAIDGRYSYKLHERSLTGTLSEDTILQWVIDSNLPPRPQLANRSESTAIYSNTGQLDFLGSCTDGNEVQVTTEAGATSSSTTQACDQGSFRISESLSEESSVDFVIKQIDPQGEVSAPLNVTWVYDVTPPLVPLVMSPFFPILNSSSSLTLFGLCEVGAQVFVDGDLSSTKDCENGQFTIDLTQSSDGDFDFTLFQMDRSGNRSSMSSLFRWTRDTTPPLAVRMDQPFQARMVMTSHPSVTVQGRCESRNRVEAKLNNQTLNSTNCSSGEFNLVINDPQEGLKLIELTQVDAVGLRSPSINFQWMRDTVSPPSLELLFPPSLTWTSNDSNLFIRGNCEESSIISVTGDYNQTQACLQGLFSLSIDMVNDGTYTFNLNQTDRAGNLSPTTVLNWIKSSQIPPTPVLLEPKNSPFFSPNRNLTLRGSCKSNFIVMLSGDSTGSLECINSQFAFELSAPMDQTSNYVIKQKEKMDSISSSGIYFSWVSDSVAPRILQLKENYLTHLESNKNVSHWEGFCEPKATITVTGAENQIFICSEGGQFSFDSMKTVDGSYYSVLNQTDLAGNRSDPLVLSWTRDTTAPEAPVVSEPTVSPFISKDSILVLRGRCEPLSVVQFSDESKSDQVNCQPDGTFSLNYTKTIDGSTTLILTQKDQFGQVSSPMEWVWVRDSSLPEWPRLLNQVESRIFTKTNQLTLKLSCDAVTGSIIHLAGIDINEVIDPQGQVDQTCVSGAVVYTILKPLDGTYRISFTQENPTNETISPENGVDWVIDRVPPGPIRMDSPSETPYTSPGSLSVAGACELKSQVFLTGQASQSQSCLDGLFHFEIQKSQDGTYSFNLFQTDLAGNSSSITPVQWIRDTQSLRPPRILVPSGLITQSSENLLIISGACPSGLNIQLDGDVSDVEMIRPAGVRRMACSMAGDFSFTIKKERDGTFDFNLRTYNDAAVSPPVALKWTRDTMPPMITVTSSATNPNLSSSITFEFQSNETSVTYICQLNEGPFQDCSSPKTLAGLPNNDSMHPQTQFTVVGVDAVGNRSLPVSYPNSSGWQQQSHQTVGLYHFSENQDSSLFGATNSMATALSTEGAPLRNSSGMWGSGYTLKPGDRLSVRSNFAHRTLRDEMTLEGFFKFSSIPTVSGTYVPLFSRWGMSSDQWAWSLRLVKGSGPCRNHLLQFVYSVDGLHQATMNSQCVRLRSNNWYFIGMKWNRGLVEFNLGRSHLLKVGVSKAAGTVVAPRSLFVPMDGNLYLGSTEESGRSRQSLWFNGSIDEVRISNTARIITDIPKREFTAD